MTKSEFISLLTHSSEISLPQTNQLEEVLESYPFFQTAHAIRLKGLKDHQSFLYPKALKRTAAHTIDRSVLFEWMSSKNFEQNAVAKKINAQTVSEESSEEVSLQELLDAKTRETEKAMDFNPPVSEIVEEKKEKEEKSSAVDSSEAHSFSEWMKLTSAKPISRDGEEKTDPVSEKMHETDLIDKFISKKPSITPPEKSDSGAVEEVSDAVPDKLMTQTLAQVYREQKNYKKAIQAYKILILKNPEKSGFFADQIRAIEKLQENKKQ